MGTKGFSSTMIMMATALSIPAYIIEGWIGVILVWFAFGLLAIISEWIYNVSQGNIWKKGAREQYMHWEPGKSALFPEEVNYQDYVLRETYKRWQVAQEMVWLKHLTAKGTITEENQIVYILSAVEGKYRRLDNLVGQYVGSNPDRLPEPQYGIWVDKKFNPTPVFFIRLAPVKDEDRKGYYYQIEAKLHLFLK